VKYDNSLVVTVTVTRYLWAPSSRDHLFTCGAIYPLPQYRKKLARWCYAKVMWSTAKCASTTK